MLNALVARIGHVSAPDLFLMAGCRVFLVPRSVGRVPRSPGSRQAAPVVDAVGWRDPRCGAQQADAAEHEADAPLLGGEDLPDEAAHAGPGRVAVGDGGGQWPPPRLGALERGPQAAPVQQREGGPAAVGGAGPDTAARVARIQPGTPLAWRAAPVKTKRRRNLWRRSMPRWFLSPKTGPAISATARRGYGRPAAGRPRALRGTPRSRPRRAAAPADCRRPTTSAGLPPSRRTQAVPP